MDPDTVSLRSIGLNTAVKGYSCMGARIVSQKHVARVNEVIKQMHEKYANIQSKHYIENKVKRIEMEEQLGYRKLQLFGYSDYFLIIPLPIGIEHEIKKLNGSVEEIGKCAFERIKEQAVENETSFEEMRDKIIAFI